MRAAPRLNRRHTGTQVDPELGIALAETDRRRPRHQPRKPERRQRQFIKSRGAFEVADANGNMINHERCIPPDIKNVIPGRRDPSRRRAGLDQLVNNRIHQRLKRPVDDVGRNADGGPALALLVFALDQHPRYRLGAAIEDTDAVVDQLQAFDVFLVFAEILAQRDVKRVDGTVALRRRDQFLAVDVDLHHRHCHRDALTVGVVALFDIDIELFDPEIFRHLAKRTPCQQIERRVGGLVGIARGLALLQFLDETGQLWVFLVVGNACPFQFGDHVGAAGLIGYQHLAVIADRLGRHVFIGLRILEHCRSVNAGFGHERAFADIGRVSIGCTIEHVVQRPRNLHQGRHLVRRHAGLEAIGKLALEPQGRDQRTQIGIAAAFAKPVQRALNLASAGAHRGQRIGDGLLGVVMGVNADVVAGDMLHHLGDDRLDLVRHGAAIGVAQYYPAGTGIVVLCDTNGGTMPHEVETIVTEVVKHIPGDHVGIHAHNDTEQAVANSLAAVRAGARQIQGTLNGLGERCGNANLCSLIPTLRLKNEFSDAFEIGVTAEKMTTLMKVSRTLDDMLNRAPNRHAAYVGESAFVTKTGIHASAVMKDPQTYEHVLPELVGNHRKVLVSDQAGRSNVIAELDRAGIAYEKNDPKLARLVEELKEREAAGYAYESADASFELLARRTLGRVQ